MRLLESDFVLEMEHGIWHFVCYCSFSILHQSHAHLLLSDVGHLIDHCFHRFAATANNDDAVHDPSRRSLNLLPQPVLRASNEKEKKRGKPNTTERIQSPTTDHSTCCKFHRQFVWIWDSRTAFENSAIFVPRAKYCLRNRLYKRAPAVTVNCNSSFHWASAKTFVWLVSSNI